MADEIDDRGSVEEDSPITPPTTMRARAERLCKTPMESIEKRLSDLSNLQRFEDWMYTLVNSLPKNGLRNLARALDTRKSGKKEELIAPIVLHLLYRSRHDEYIDVIFRTSQCGLTMEGMKKRVRVKKATFQVLPAHDVLLNRMSCADKAKYLRLSSVNGGLGRPIANDLPDIHLCQNGKSPAFSLNEFARLIVLIRDDEHVTRAVHKAILHDLTSIEVKSQVQRDSFWAIVEHRFNSADANTELDLRCRVDDVNAAMSPLCFRPASLYLSVFVR